ETDFKNQRDYWLKSTEYHASIDSKMIDLLEMIGINVNLFEPYIIEKKIIKKDFQLNEIETVEIDRSQAIKLSTGEKETIITEKEFSDIKKDLVNFLNKRIFG
ncbi:MAG: hypothetical protein KBT48_01810, partial [Firmicutes bacterium]|nr:hypothetical protein [Bacillota bacterium]